MTILHSPDDELISAYIDGAGTEADAAHIESCPTCQARVAELRGVAAHVGATVPPPDPIRRDRAVAAAIAARASAGRRRVASGAARLRHPLVPLLLAGAALVALLSFFVFGGSGDDADVRGRGEVLTADIGAVDDPDDLAERLTAGLQQAETRAASGDPAATADRDDFPCETQARDELAVTTAPVLSALVEWRGTDAVVHVYERADGGSITRRAVVLAQDRCVPLSRRTL